MSDYKQQVGTLLAQARGNSDSDVALLEEAVRIVDCHLDVTLGFDTRLKLISAGTWSGNYEVVIAAFAWCLAQVDREDALRSRSQHTMLWYYKWVVGSLSQYAQVSREQLERSFADMTERYVRAGLSMGAIHKLRASTAIRLGDLDAHRTARALWENSPSDGSADCPACETNALVSFYLETGDLEGAVRVAEPIITGRQKCNAIPCATFGNLLLPMLKLGDSDQAQSFNRRAIRQATSSREYLDNIGNHCAYLAITGKFTKAVRTFETGLSWLAVMRRTWDRMLFLQNAVVVFERLAEARNEPLALKVPKAEPFYREDGAYQPSTVAEALRAMLSESISQLNRRNGNSYMDQRYQAFRDLIAGIPTIPPETSSEG